MTTTDTDAGPKRLAPGYRVQVLGLAALFTSDPSDAALLAANAGPLIEWLEQAPYDPHDKENDYLSDSDSRYRYITGETRRRDTVLREYLGAAGVRDDDPARVIAGASALYEFMMADGA